MRIDRFEVYHVAMPLIYPWRTAYGEDYEIHSVVVRAVSGEYDSADDLNERLGVFKGNSFAKAAIEICWWTLQSAITGTPVHRLLGGETREVQAGADFGIQDSYDMLLGNIQQAVDAGFPRIKLKVARGWDLEMLRIVRDAFPDTTFHIDCNSGYSLDDLPFFQAIDDLGLAFIEQPLHYADVLDHAELAKRIQTPVCLDESIVSIKAAEQAISVGACEYINIKPGRVGGLANAKAIHDLCHDAGIPVWIGGMLESALGSAICVEVATLPNFTYPGDLFPSSRFYTEDLSDPPMELTPRKTFRPLEGRLPTPDRSRLEKLTVQSRSVA